MKRTTVIVITILLFVICGYTQTNLPEYGKVSDLIAKSKVYVATDPESRKVILKELGKHSELSIVNRPEDADFFIEYKTLSRQRVGQVMNLDLYQVNGQIEIYYYKAEKKVIAWTESLVGGRVAERLIKKFFKDFKEEKKDGK